MNPIQRLVLLFEFAGLLLAAPGARALDFTPHTIPHGSEQLACFLDGQIKHVLRVPEEVSVFGEKGETTFLFKQLDGASLTIKPSPIQSGAGFGDAELEPYRQALASFVPQGARNAVVKKEEPSPLNNRVWTGYQFTQEYKLPGRAICQTVTYVNLTGQPQFVLIITAPVELFKAAQEASFAILNTWRVVQPGEDPGTANPL